TSASAPGWSRQTRSATKQLLWYMQLPCGPAHPRRKRHYTHKISHRLLGGVPGVDRQSDSGDVPSRAPAEVDDRIADVVRLEKGFRLQVFKGRLEFGLVRVELVDRFVDGHRARHRGRMHGVYPDVLLAKRVGVVPHQSDGAFLGSDIAGAA